jgi:hypothetical protein
MIDSIGSFFYGIIILFLFYFNFFQFRWVPEGSVLTPEHDRYLLDAEENAAYNDLHDRIMSMEEEEFDE